MSKNLFRISACIGVVLGASFISIKADENPTSTTNAKQFKPLMGVTSLTIDLPTSSKGNVQAFLNAPVSFIVKDASFMGALDAILSANGKMCPIECRRLKPMKLTFGAKAEKAGNVLDALAKAGGCNLYVLPDKLLLSSSEMLMQEERAKAQPFSALLTPDGAPQLKFVPGGISEFDILDVVNTSTSVSIDHLSVSDALEKLSDSVGKPVNYEYRLPTDRRGEGFIATDVTSSFSNLKFGDALSVVAHLNGCELYLLPDKFLICAPDALTVQEQKNAVPAFKRSVVPILDPSAPAA